MTVQVVRCGATLPESFETLRAAAKAEGYEFLDRLHSRWQANAYLDDPDASVFCVFAEEAVIAIGAQTLDDYEPGAAQRRIRHFYVRPDLRRGGVGRTLAGALVQQALALAPLVTLRATHDLSRAFWDAMGFTRVIHPTRSHEIRRSS